MIITYNHKTYPNIKSLANEYGIAPYNLAYRLRNGWALIDAITTPPKNVARKRGKIAWNAIPICIQINGCQRQFNSISEACDKLNLPYIRIYHRIKKGMSHQKAFNLATQNRNCREVRFVENGEEVFYPSISSACKDRGLSKSKVGGRLARKWTLEEAFEVVERTTLRNSHNACPVHFTHAGYSYSFPSHAEASRYFKLNRSTVTNRVNNGWSWPEAVELSPRKDISPSGRGGTFGNIYVVRLRENGKEYIGQTRVGLEERIRGHVQDSHRPKTEIRPKSLAFAIKQYGIEAFEFFVIDTASTQSSLNNKEKHWIKERGSISPAGFNISRGGTPATIKGKQTIIAGQHYPSISEAARSFNLDPRIVSARLISGWTVDQAVEMERRPENRYGAKEIRFTFNNELYEFESIKECAHHFGLRSATLVDRLHSDWPILEALGLSKRNFKKNLILFNDNGLDMEFPNLSAAARFYKINRGTVQGRINRGWSTAQALKRPLDSRKASEVHIKDKGGTTSFPSLYAACKNYNMRDDTVRKRLKYGWTIEEALGIKKRNTKAGNRKPITITENGKKVNYDSTTAAAEKHGLRPAQVSERLRLGWSPEQAVGVSERPNLNGISREVKFEHQGENYTFKSQTECAHHFNMDQRRFSYLLSKGFSAAQAVGLEVMPRVKNSPRILHLPVNAKIARMNATEASEIFGVTLPTIIYRLNSGWSQEQAVGLEPPPPRRRRK